LHRVGCAGIIDADGRTDQEAVHLERMGVYRLPVSEVENLLLLPNVFLAIAKALQFNELDAQTKLSELQTFVFNQVHQQIDTVCVRYTKRRIDAEMKKIGLSAPDIFTLDIEFRAAASRIDAQVIFAQAKSEVSAAIAGRNYEKVLFYYDNKGLLAQAAKQLGYQQRALEEFVGRALRSDEKTELHTALAASLPTVTIRPNRHSYLHSAYTHYSLSPNHDSNSILATIAG
jgi:hypothetical protein